MPSADLVRGREFTAGSSCTREASGGALGCARNCASSGRRSPPRSRPGRRTRWRARCGRRAAPSTPRNPRARGRGSCSSAGGSADEAEGCSSCAGCGRRRLLLPAHLQVGRRACARRRTRRFGRRRRHATSSSTATARSTTRRAGLARVELGRQPVVRSAPRICAAWRAAARRQRAPVGPLDGSLCAEAGATWSLPSTARSRTSPTCSATMSRRRRRRCCRAGCAPR